MTTDIIFLGTFLNTKQTLSGLLDRIISIYPNLEPPSSSDLEGERDARRETVDGVQGTEAEEAKTHKTLDRASDTPVLADANSTNNKDRKAEREDTLRTTTMDTTRDHGGAGASEH